MLLRRRSFVSVRRNAKHANRRRLALATNFPVLDLELDGGGGRQCAATVLLIPQNVLAISMGLR